MLLRRLSFKERRERVRQNLEDAWRECSTQPADPGLRELYPDIPRAPIRLVSCPLRKDANQGGLLRLADGFRLEGVDLSPEEDGARDFSGGAGVWDWQPYRWVDAAEALAALKSKGCRAFGLSLSEGAKPIPKIAWQFPAAIVLGAELDGLTPEAEALCDELVAIPLYGLMGSLNVGMAAAIAVHSAVCAYAEQNPEFQPVRNASRRLLGLDEAEYR